MNDVEALNDKLKSFESPEEFKKFVLWAFVKDRNLSEEEIYNKLLKKYDTPHNKYMNEFHIVRKYYIDWGLLEKMDNDNLLKASPKGREALCWRYIAPQKPEWLTKNVKFWIKIGISILTLLFSIVTIKSCN